MFKNENPDLHYYGGPCKKNNHHQIDNKNPRRISGECRACFKGLPPGLIENLDGCHEKVNDIPDNRSPEQIAKDKAKHIESVTKWNKQNKGKCKEYIKKYTDRPEIKALGRERARLYSQNYRAKKRAAKLNITGETK